MTIAKATSECESANKPNPRFDHAYAIVRVDDFLGPDVPTKNKVTVKKVMRDADAAEAEARRLNSLQRGDGVHYFVQTTRLEKVEWVSPAGNANGQSTGLAAAFESTEPVPGQAMGRE